MWYDSELLQLGNFELARSFFNKAIGLQPRIISEEPRKTAVTGAAILVASVLGKERFTALVRPYLRNAA